MGSSGFNFVITWGFLGLGLGILLIIALLWCRDVNRKLNYILMRIYKFGSDKGKEDNDLNSVEHRPVAGTGKAVSPLVAVGIIIGAIILLFLVPLWLINR
ncbi:MAG: hypothetical protein A2787_03255 [Omnitrophica WOR_2 bacterium RIFCSPHIGHO2_01_FULL_48_9]|nr:MAG: hypothetical protein A3D10_01085 [Omnitrophica WOR_2 bacterium RIFCSPHIGHO2_02_FULL_48_11]OGX32034.1 MAG: hypothetical protein A2787_03255 [Omnitrophica WOR_2 bacterium RIFCSPHIGHO2_01_FULL_48_9]